MLVSLIKTTFLLILALVGITLLGTLLFSILTVMKEKVEEDEQG